MRVRKNRAVISAAVSAAAVLAFGASAHGQTDAFVKFYGTSNAIGGYAFNAAGDTVYQANFSPNQGFTRFLFSGGTGGTWTGTTFVGPTDMTTFAQSDSVAGSGSLPATPSGGTVTMGDVILNPASLTINRVGAGPITYPAGSIGVIVDQP